MRDLLFRETPQLLDLVYAQLLIALTATQLHIPRVLVSYILKDFSGPGWFCGLQIHIRGGELDVSSKLANDRRKDAGGF